VCKKQLQEGQGQSVSLNNKEAAAQAGEQQPDKRRKERKQATQEPIAAQNLQQLSPTEP
jgi:hypothetical protein